jgi:hypothetical protein
MRTFDATARVVFSSQGAVELTIVDLEGQKLCVRAHDKFGLLTG